MCGVCSLSLSAWWWVSFGAEGERGLLQKVLKLFSLPPFSESEEVEEVGGGDCRNRRRGSLSQPGVGGKLKRKGGRERKEAFSDQLPRSLLCV